MTDTERQLLAAVKENPDEDTVKLVYADYLQETGETEDYWRAEFIRASIKYEEMGYCWVKSPQAYHIGFTALPVGVEGRFYRGFCRSIQCTMDVFEKTAAEVFLRQPLITEVLLTDRLPWIANDGDRHYCGWHCLKRKGGYRTADELPEYLTELMTRPRSPYYEPGWWGTATYYDNSADAHADLSQACVRYGLTVAGWEVASVS